MKRIISLLLFSFCFLLLASCSSEEEGGAGNKTDVFNYVYSPELLTAQMFTIRADMDNILTSEKGTRLRINKNTFVDANGHTISGEVNIQLKEAFTMKDIVMANLTTTYNGKPLQTGGMIYLSAVSGNDNLFIAENKEIFVSMPADSLMSGMSVFEGVKDSSGIKWVNPVALQTQDVGEDDTAVVINRFEKTTNITYSVDGFPSGRAEDFPPEVNDEVSRIGWAGDGLKIKRDSVIMVGKYTVRLYYNDSLWTWSQTFSNVKGENSFAEDQQTNYIFSIKKLGWANIDRLLDDARTKAVDLVTEIENEGDFKFIYVTMVTKNMYLPGYQKKDQTFGFSHNDEEPQQLPVGESATILATAYINGIPYFALKKIVIAEKQTVVLKLEQTNMTDMKKVLQEKL